MNELNARDLRVSNLPRRLEIAKQGGAVVTFGIFDGVHRGHQEILHQVSARARDLKALSIAIVFRPRPVEALGIMAPRPYYSAQDETASLIKKCGINEVGLLKFSRQVALMPADEFLTSLAKRIPMIELWMGQDARVGRGEKGGYEEVVKLSAKLGFATKLFGTDKDLPRGIPSPDISLQELNRILGRAYSIPCFVGDLTSNVNDQLGAFEVSFPTLLHLPPPGDYAVICKQLESADPSINESAPIDCGMLRIDIPCAPFFEKNATLISLKRNGWTRLVLTAKFMLKVEVDPVFLWNWVVSHVGSFMSEQD